MRASGTSQYKTKFKTLYSDTSSILEYTQKQSEKNIERMMSCRRWMAGFDSPTDQIHYISIINEVIITSIVFYIQYIQYNTK